MAEQASAAAAAAAASAPAPAAAPVDGEEASAAEFNIEEHLDKIKWQNAQFLLVHPRKGHPEKALYKTVGRTLTLARYFELQQTLLDYAKRGTEALTGVEEIAKDEQKGWRLVGLT